MTHDNSSLNHCWCFATFNMLQPQVMVNRFNRGMPCLAPLAPHQNATRRESNGRNLRFRSRIDGNRTARWFRRPTKPHQCLLHLVLVLFSLAFFGNSILSYSLFPSSYQSQPCSNWAVFSGSLHRSAASKPMAGPSL